MAKSDFFGSMKGTWIFLGREKNERFFWVAKKGLRDIFGYARKSSDFYRQTNSEVVIFWGIKYEPQSDLPPVIKTCEWGPKGEGYLTYIAARSTSKSIPLNPHADLYSLM